MVKTLRAAELEPVGFATCTSPARHDAASHPEQRIKQLEAELETSRQQSLVYKTMLDVLSREHGVAVVKKPSPEQRKSLQKRKA